MDLCNSNSIHNNYTYNHTKCKVIVCHKSANEYKNANREWNLGPNSVDEGTTYLHWGNHNETNMNLDENVQECCSKLRRTHFSLKNYAIIRNSMYPLSLKRIYETIVLSKALYGSEL